jgi:hypothetical protein
LEPQELSVTLRQVARAADALSLHALETTASAHAMAELLPPVREVVDQAVVALGAVLDRYDGTEHVDVADLAFVARLELLSHQQQLGVLQPLDAVAVLSQCGSAKRSVTRSIFAVDRALCTVAGLPFEGAEGGRQELAHALRVRKGYAHLRRDLLALGQPEPHQVEAALQRAANLLGALVQGPLFAELRLDDRLQLLQLRTRLSSWLDGATARDLQSGLRLWQDLAGFVSLLVQINHRTELVEHDRSLVQRAWAELFGGKPRTSVPAELAARLQDLYGRDDGIDGMLDAGMGQFAVEWSDGLERLQRALGLA